MHILFVTHKFPPSIGGMQKQSFELFKGASLHAKTTLIAPEEGEGALSFYASLKSRIKYVLATNSDISVIHLNDGVMGVACIWLTRYTDIPIVLTVHGLDISFPNYFYKKFVATYFNRYNGIVAVSQYTASVCLDRGVDRDKVFVINNGVDCPEKSIGDDSVYNKLKTLIGDSWRDRSIIMACGRAVKRKGFSWFMEEVLPSLDNVIFIMVGPLQEERVIDKLYDLLLPGFVKRQLDLFLARANDSVNIRSLLKSQNQGSSYHLGKVSALELEALYNLADIFIMPNIPVPGDAEGFGLVALEAGSREVPVIASRLEGITDAIIHEKNGLLIPAQDKIAWIETIHRVLADPAYSRRLGSSAREINLTRFSWDQMVKRYIRLFERISEKKARLIDG